MIKEKKILYYFIGWLLLGIFIFLVGIINVSADTYIPSQFEGKLFDNYGPSLSGVTTNLATGGWSGIIPSMTANSSGAAWGFSSPIPIIANHTYALSVIIDGSYGGNLTLSTYNRVGIGSTMSSAEESYENNTKVKEVTSKSIPASNMLQFVFTAESSASYVVIPFATTYSGSNQNYVLSSVIINDLGSNSLTENEINNSLSNQTNELNNSINNSTNIITGEIDNLGEDIKDSINDNFNNCRNSNNLLPVTATTTTNYGITFSVQSDGSIILNGTSTELATFTISQNISLNAGKYYILPTNSDKIYFIGYTGSSWPVSLRGSNNSFTLSSDTSFIQFYYQITAGSTFNNFKIQPMISKEIITNYEQYGSEVCSNKIDETNDKLDQTNNQLGDLNNNITNDNIDNNNISNSFNEFENFIDENATISTLITLPVTLFSAILNGLQNSCSPFNLGSLYGENLILPCINLSSYLGNTLWTMIDIIISGFAIYFISKKFIKVFNNFSSMKEGDVIDD